ncbi:MAG: ATP-binding protein [Candidatus Omnitrophica bacterium]|nr:ATP-binding protein [Candidatus Omnitrophota bacterium]
MFKKIIAFFISFCFAFEQIGFAQIAGQLDISARMSSLIGSVVYENYRPVHLRYLSYDQLNNDFKLLLDKGSVKDTKPATLETTASDLLRHFFVGIALPNDFFWVNLRPDSPKEMIDDDLAKTDMGKVMLEADLQLKKDTAKYTSPETFEGREYWDKLYKRAEELYGSENVTIPTLTRPWIVPDEIIVREAQGKGSAYIYKATLKVMLEQDYLKGDANYSFPDEKSKILNEYSSQIIRETIIPKLTREVNSSKRYAPLRQVYYSLILAQWFKKSHKDIKSKVARKIDAKNLSNLTSKTKWDKNVYFKAYQKSFKDGEYNIRENHQSAYGQTIRTYFSGGVEFNKISANLDGGTFQGAGELSKALLSKLLSLEGDDGGVKISDLGPSVQEDGGVSVDSWLYDHTRNSPVGSTAKQKKIVFGQAGYRITDIEKDNDYGKNGGWKLHLTVKPENYAAVDKWLFNNHERQYGQYKLLRGGDRGEKDFTIYIGSWENAKRVADKIESEIGHFLEKSKASGDKMFSNKGLVAGRFDIQHIELYKEYKNEGRNGVPFDDRAVTDRNWAPVGEREALITKHVDRIDAFLRDTFGEYYTGPENQNSVNNGKNFGKNNWIKDHLPAEKKDGGAIGEKMDIGKIRTIVGLLRTRIDKLVVLLVSSGNVRLTDAPLPAAPALPDESVLKGAELNSAIDQVIKDLLPHKSKYQLYRQLSKTGSFVFGSYDGYLNEKGLEAKKFFDEIAARSEEDNFNWFGHFGEFKEQLKLIPRIGNELGDLHLELFREAFEGMNAYQIQAFCDVGRGSGKNFLPRRSVTLLLTQGCSNMCLICGIRGLEQPHFGGQMPFPVAVKIMQKLKSSTDDIAPYRDSDPLDYYDEASGATIVDIVDVAQKLGFKDISIVTHGTNYNRKKAPAIARELNRMVRMDVSVHVYHGDVMGYALDVLDASKDKDELLKRRERIVNKYVDKYAALVEAAQSGKGGELRVFRQGPVLKQILDSSLYAEAMKGLGRTPRVLNEQEKKGLARALIVIRQMELIQDEVWEKVQKRVNVAPDKIFDFRVLWIGRASQLLKKLGVPEDIISAIQEADKQKTNLSDNVFDPVVETDGHLSVAISEDATRIFRPVGEIFKDYRSREFKLFVELLRASVTAKYNRVDDAFGPRLEDVNFKQEVLQDMKRFLEAKGLSAEGITVDDFEVRLRYFNYINSLISLSFPQANKLLMGLTESREEVSDAKAQEIYQAVRDMPFNVASPFQVIFHNWDKFTNLESVLDSGYLNEYRFIYSFAPGGDNLASKRHILEPYNKFELKGWSAFSRAEPNDAAPGDGGSSDQKQSLWTFRDTHQTNDDLRWRTFSNREKLPASQSEDRYYKAYFNPRSESFDDAVELAKSVLSLLKWPASFKHIEEKGEDVNDIARKDGWDKKNDSDYSKIVFYARTAEELLDLVKVFNGLFSRAPGRIKTYPGGLSYTLKINDLLQVGFGSRELYQQAKDEVVVENKNLVNVFARAGIILQERNQLALKSRKVGGDSLAKSFAREFGETVRVQANGASWEFRIFQNKVNWQGFKTEGKAESSLRGEFSMGDFQDIVLRKDSFAIKIEKKDNRKVFNIKNISFPDGVTVEWDSEQKDGGKNSLAGELSGVESEFDNDIRMYKYANEAYSLPPDIVVRIKQGNGNKETMKALMDEKYEQILASIAGLSEEQRLVQENKLGEMKSLLDSVWESADKTKTLESLFAILSAWVTLVRQQKKDYHRLYLLRDAGLFKEMEDVISADEAEASAGFLGSLAGLLKLGRLPASSRNDAGSSAYYLSRDQISGEDYRNMHSNADQMTSLLVRARYKVRDELKSGTSPDLGRLYVAARGLFEEQYENNEKFKLRVDNIFFKLVNAGYDKKDKLLIVDTGIRGTAAFFVKNVLDLHMRKQGREIFDKDGKEKIQVALLEVSSEFDDLPKIKESLFAYDLAPFAAEERDRLEKLVAKFRHETTGATAFGIALEHNVNAHPIRFNLKNLLVEESSPEAKLAFFFEQILAAEMALAWRGRISGKNVGPSGETTDSREFNKALIQVLQEKDRATEERPGEQGDGGEKEQVNEILDQLAGVLVKQDTGSSEQKQKQINPILEKLNNFSPEKVSKEIVQRLISGQVIIIKGENTFSFGGEYDPDEALAILFDNYIQGYLPKQISREIFHQLMAAFDASSRNAELVPEALVFAQLINKSIRKLSEDPEAFSYARQAALKEFKERIILLPHRIGVIPGYQEYFDPIFSKEEGFKFKAGGADKLMADVLLKIKNDPANRNNIKFLMECRSLITKGERLSIEDIQFIPNYKDYLETAEFSTVVGFDFKPYFFKKTSNIRDVLLRKRILALEQEALLRRKMLRNILQAFLGSEDSFGVFSGLLEDMEREELAPDAQLILLSTLLNSWQKTEYGKNHIYERMVAVTIKVIRASQNDEQKINALSILVKLTNRHRPGQSSETVINLVSERLPVLAKSILAEEEAIRKDSAKKQDILKANMEELEYLLQALAGIAGRTINSSEPLDRDLTTKIIKIFIETADSKVFGRNIAAESASNLSPFIARGNPAVLEWFAGQLAGGNQQKQNLMALLTGMPSDKELREILKSGIVDQERKIGYLLLLRFQDRRELLRQIIRDEKTDISLRLYAFTLYCGQGFGYLDISERGDVESAFDEGELTRLMDYLAPEVNTFVRGVFFQNKEAYEGLLNNIVLQDEVLKTYAAAVLLVARQQVPKANSKDIADTIYKIRNARLQPYWNNANSDFVVGGFNLVGLRRPGAVFLQILAHEIMHDLLLARYPVKDLSSGIMHEALADLYAKVFFNSFAEPGELDSQEFEKELFYQKDFEAVINSNGNAIESHEGARAQLQLIRNFFNNHLIDLDVNRLMQIGFKALIARGPFSEEGISEIFSDILQRYIKEESGGSSSSEYGFGGFLVKFGMFSKSGFKNVWLESSANFAQPVLPYGRIQEMFGYPSFPGVYGANQDKSPQSGDNPAAQKDGGGLDVEFFKTEIAVVEKQLEKIAGFELGELTSIPGCEMLGSLLKYLGAKKDQNNKTVSQVLETIRKLVDEAEAQGKIREAADLNLNSFVEKIKLDMDKPAGNGDVRIENVEFQINGQQAFGQSINLKTYPVVLELIIREFVLNAIKKSYSEDEINAGRNKQDLKQIRIVVNLLSQENKVQIRIIDQGVGMDEETKKRIFAAGSTVDSKPDVKLRAIFQSTNLGLSFVRDFSANILEGEVYASSSGLGQGSEFGITLPLVNTKPLADKYAEPISQAIRHDIRNNLMAPYAVLTFMQDSELQAYKKKKSETNELKPDTAEAIDTLLKMRDIWVEMYKKTLQQKTIKIIDKEKFGTVELDGANAGLVGKIGVFAEKILDVEQFREEVLALYGQEKDGKIIITDAEEITGQSANEIESVPDEARLQELNDIHKQKNKILVGFLHNHPLFTEMDSQGVDRNVKKGPSSQDLDDLYLREQDYNRSLLGIVMECKFGEDISPAQVDEIMQDHKKIGLENIFLYFYQHDPKLNKFKAAEGISVGELMKKYNDVSGAQKDGGKQTTLDQFDAQDMIDRLEVIPLTGKMELISKTGEVLAIIESRKGRLKNALRLEFNGYDPQFIIDNKSGLLEQVLKIAALVDIRHLALKGGEEYNRNFTKDVLKISAEENIRTIISGNLIFISGRRLDVDSKGGLVLQADGGKPKGPGIGEWLNPAQRKIYLRNAAKSIDMITSSEIMQPVVLPPSLPQKPLTPEEQEEYDKEYNDLLRMQAEIFAAQAGKEKGLIYQDGGNIERAADASGVPIVLQDGFEISSAEMKTYGAGKGIIVVIWDQTNKKGALLNFTDTGVIPVAIKSALSEFNVAPRTLEFRIIAGKDRDRKLAGFLPDFLKLQSPKDIKRDISDNSLRNILFDPKTGKHFELKDVLSGEQRLAEQKIQEDPFMPGTRGHLEENRAEWKYVRPQLPQKAMPDLGKMTDEDIRKIIGTWELKGADWLGELSQKIEQEYNQGQSEGRKYVYFARNEVRKIGVPADLVEAPGTESRDKNGRFIEAEAYIFNAVVAKKNSLEKAIKASVLEISRGKVDGLFSFKFTIQRLPGRPFINISWDKVAISRELEGNQYGVKAVENFAKVLAKYFGGASITTEVIHDKALESFQRNFEAAICTRPRLKSGPLSADNSETWKAVVPGQPLTAETSGSLDGGIPVAKEQEGEADSQGPLGGIDFRGLPIVNQPGAIPAGINQFPSVNIADLDGEWQQIERMAATEMVPSTQRLKEFLGACCSKGALDKYAGNVLACIADILRLEEEQAKSTEPALRDILILLESNRPENELQQSLSFITVTAGQPQA